MQFLITALGSFGDVHPMAGLAAGLRRREHDVSVVASPYFEDVIAQTGAEFLAAGTREEYLQLTNDPNLWHPMRGIKVVFGETLKNLRPLYDLLSERIIPGETVLVAHGLDFASRLIGETEGVPVAAVNFAPQAFWSEYRSPQAQGALVGPRVPRWLKRLQFACAERWALDPIMAPPLNAMRKELGLPPVRNVFSTWWHRATLVMGLFPEWFAPPQPDWPQGTVLTGFPLWDGGEQRGLSDELETFLAAGQPPLVFAPGSANRQAGEFFRTAVEACARLDRPGILLTRYEEQLPSSLPPTVRHEHFVPLSRLLPRAAAFVHHGGIGSCAQGLSAGVPHVVRPMAFDQHDNASRLIDLGVGEQLLPRRFSPHALEKCLRRLLTSRQVSTRCAEFAGRCDGPAAISRACDALERLGTAVAVR